MKLEALKMKIILTVAVVACFLAVATAQLPNLNCVTRVTEVASCVTRLGSAIAGGDNDAFCNECGNSLVSYYNDCTGGVGTSAVQQSKLKVLCTGEVYGIIMS